VPFHELRPLLTIMVGKTALLDVSASSPGANEHQDFWNTITYSLRSGSKRPSVAARPALPIPFQRGRNRRGKIAPGSPEQASE
jgi:hypothetical protein